MRRLTYFLLVIFYILEFCLSFAQKSEKQKSNKKGDLSYKYHRSSLSMILIESDDFPDKSIVMNSWNNYPFPDKYNKHNIKLKSIDISKIKLSDRDLIEAGFLKDTLNRIDKIKSAEMNYNTLMSNILTQGDARPLKYLNNEKNLAVLLPSEKQEFQIKIDKVIREQKIAHQLVESWFNRKPDGTFDMSVVQDRGRYNASELEASIARGQIRGLAALADAGEELIKNTFVTFTKLEFIENEPVAAMIRDLSKIRVMEQLKGKPEMLIQNALKAVDETYEKTKEGYSLWSKTWLYRLKWNDSISTIFYSNLWSNPPAFDKTDLFSLEFVGVQYNQSLVTFKIGETRSKEQIIDLVLVRNLDNAFAELQKRYDVFKPKVPVLSVKPITAQIGMKEGLKGGESFNVLEMTINPKSGLTEYKKVGKVKVDKNRVWDNRYYAGEKVEPKVDKKGNLITATSFKGGNKSIQPGMLLKQIK